MYVISLKNKLSEGLYAVESESGERILYLFIHRDDAERFAGLLEADNYPKLDINEIEDEHALEICKNNNYKYLIISPNDLMIPPDYYDIF